MKFVFKRLLDFRFWLTNQHIPIVLAVLSILLSSQALTAGLVLDDWWQKYYFVSNKTLCGQEFNDFFVQFYGADGTHETLHKCLDFGLFPWWTTEDYRLFFWRPLTEITHRLETYLWPDSPFLMHLQSLLWLGLTVFVASILYRRIIGPTWMAGLAALLFVFDDSHLMPAVWIAARNVTLAVLFGILALIIHDKWRRDAWRPGAFLSPACLLAGLLSGESAIVTCAYLFSYAVFVDSGKVGGKILSLTPFFVLGIVYLVAYNIMGYGASGSGGYGDPLNEPAKYLMTSLERLPVFLLGQWTIVNSDLVLSMPKDSAEVFTYISIVLLVLIGVAIFPIIIKKQSSKFWFLGMLLVAIALPGRMLMFVALGVFGLLSEFAGCMLDKSEWLPQYKSYRIYAFCVLAILGFMHLVGAPCMYLVTVNLFDKPFKVFVDDPANSSVFISDSQDQQTILVNSPSHLYTANIIAQRLAKRLPVSKYNRTLADGSESVKVMRTDSKTIIVEPQNGFITGVADDLWRAESSPMKIGQKVELTGMTVEVLLMTENNHPQRVKFSFDKPLEDRSYKFLQWTDKGYIPFALPSAGKTAIIPATKTLSEVIKESF